MIKRLSRVPWRVRGPIAAGVVSGLFSNVALFFGWSPRFEHTVRVVASCYVLFAIVLVMALWAAGRQFSLRVVGTVAFLTLLELLVQAPGRGGLLLFFLPATNGYFLFRLIDDRTPLAFEHAGPFILSSLALCLPAIALVFIP